MTTVTLRRPLAYRVIVTEKFRQEMTEELQRAADDVQAQIEQLEFQSRRYLLELQKTNLSQAMAVRDEIEKEKRKQQRVKEEILNRKKQVAELPDGERFLRGTLEGFVEASVGENLRDLLGGAEIVVKDDIIVEIKDGRGTG
jgi:hypothetical protein